MKRGLYFLLVFFLLGSSLSIAQRYPRKKILRDLKELAGFENAFIGFKLYDPERKKVIAEQYADKHMTPASTTKLFTFNAGLQYLPETLPALEYKIIGDSLIFWSTGYPLTLHPDHPDSTVINFLAQSNKQLYYWPRPMQDDRFGPGWGWDDYAGYYGAEKSVFPIYGNSVQVIIDNEKKTFKTSPEYPGFKFTESDSTDSRARVNRDEFWNEFEIKYKALEVTDTVKVDTLIRPFRYSDALFVDLLSNAAGKKINTINRKTRPDNYETLAGVRADSLYKWMLQPSDNLFAEQILMIVSGLTSDTLSTEKAIDFYQAEQSLTSPPIFQEKLIWRDGSGLSRYNMFKPDELVFLLNSFDIEKVLHFLPQGQTSGTLEDWYSPSIYAKTGTLSNNHSLAGYIKTDSGRTLILVIMANHYTTPISTVRESFGVMLEKIRKGY